MSYTVKMENEKRRERVTRKSRSYLEKRAASAS